MSSDGIDKGRRKMITLSTAAVGAVGCGFAAVPFLSSWQPSARAQAAGAPKKVDISKIAPGQKLVVEYRGKPVFVVRRTEEALKRLASNDSNLRDPNSEVVEQQPSYAQNPHRSIKPEFMVLTAICTHLGCVPQYLPKVESDWNGGFFCPCHGSKFDMAGRVYQSVPAPTNLAIPEYSFINDNEMIIGVGQGEAS
jgi:ubiquinol-cytochrome c reductase iron-sulfur subunit